MNRVPRAKTARPSDSVSQKTTLPKLQLEQHHATTYWRTRFCPLLHHLWTWPTLPRHLRHSDNTSFAHMPPFSLSSSSANENSLRKIKIKAHCECYHGFVVYVWLEDRVLAALFADASGSVAGLGVGVGVEVVEFHAGDPEIPSNWMKGFMRGRRTLYSICITMPLERENGMFARS